MAQYSIPFCVALSLYDDPTDPESFNEKKLKDKKILAMMRKVRLKVDREIEQKGWDRAARVTVGLANKQRPSKLDYPFQRHAAKSAKPDGSRRQGAQTDARDLVRRGSSSVWSRRSKTLEKLDDVSSHR